MVFAERTHFFRHWLFALAALCFFVCSTFSGCTASPTLPVPPPSALTSAPDADGFVTITGSNANPAALVSAYNENLEIGVIVRPEMNGEFTLRLRAESGHGVSVWQVLGTTTSELVSLAVP